MFFLTAQVRSIQKNVINIKEAKCVFLIWHFLTHFFRKKNSIQQCVKSSQLLLKLTSWFYRAPNQNHLTKLDFGLDHQKQPKNAKNHQNGNFSQFLMVFDGLFFYFNPFFKKINSILQCVKSSQLWLKLTSWFYCAPNQTHLTNLGFQQ